MRRVWIAIALAIALVVAATPAGAVSLYTFSGYVRDAIGRPLGATSTRGPATVSDGRGQSVVTDANGRYVLEESGTGHFDIVAERFDVAIEPWRTDVLVPLGQTHDFAAYYGLTTATDRPYVSTASSATTLDVNILSMAPEPGVSGQAGGRSCVQLEDARTGSTVSATFQSIDAGGIARWSVSLPIPVGSSEGQHLVRAWAEDCSSGTRLSVESELTYTIDNTAPSIPRDQLFPADGGNAAFTSQPLGARITDELSGVDPSSIRFTLYGTDTAAAAAAGASASRPPLFDAQLELGSTWSQSSSWAKTQAVELEEGGLYGAGVVAFDRAGNRAAITPTAPWLGGGFLVSPVSLEPTTASIPATECQVGSSLDTTGRKTATCTDVALDLASATLEMAGGWRHGDVGFVDHLVALDTALVSSDVGGVPISLPATQPGDASWAPKTASMRFQAQAGSAGAQVLATPARRAPIGTLITKVPATWTTATLTMGGVSTSPQSSACVDPTASAGPVPCSPDPFDSRFLVSVDVATDPATFSDTLAQRYAATIREVNGDRVALEVPFGVLGQISEEPGVTEVVRESSRFETFPDDFAGVADLSDLRPALVQAFGARYGGMWIDRSVGASTLRVNVRDATGADDAALSAVTSGNARVAVRSVQQSETDIGVAIADVKALEESNIAGYSHDRVTDQLVIFVREPATSELREQLEAILPVGSWRVAVAPVGTYGHEQRTDYPPYEGGLKLTVMWPTMVPRPGTCTSAFTVISHDLFYGTTAGHCGADGTGIWVGAQYLGTTMSNGMYPFYTMSSDSQRYRTSYPTARIMTARNGHRSVRGVEQDADLELGQRACYQGGRSGGDNCGGIWQILHDLVVPGDAVKNIPERKYTTMWFSTVPFGECVGGDSGGPVYQVRDNRAFAQGLVSICSNDAQHGVSIPWFTSARAMEISLDASIALDLPSQ